MSSSYGKGRGQGAFPGPYGTNEGDIWSGTGSDIQARLDAEGEGMLLIHEIIGGEESLYVTALPDLKERALQGDVLYHRQKASEN